MDSDAFNVLRSDEPSEDVRVVRELLREPLPATWPSEPPNATWLTCKLVFLKEAIADDDNDALLLARWREAQQVLAHHRTFRWGSEEHRAALVKIAQTEHIVRAIQAARSFRWARSSRFGFWAVLATEGSDASADALMPAVHHALTSGDGLEELEYLRRLAASTAPMRAMIAQIGKLLDERSARSPIVVMLRKRGVDVTECDFRIKLVAAEPSLAYAGVTIASRSKLWLYVHATNALGRQSAANNEQIIRDELGLTPSILHTDVPRFLSRAATRLGVEWQWNEARIHSNLWGRNRQELVSWLREWMTRAGRKIRE